MDHGENTGLEGSGGNYRAFLLRCWQEPGREPGGEAAWRFTLVEAGDQGAKRGFACLEELVDYLRAELEGIEAHSSGD